jgi:hypothetical protein
MKTIHLSFGEQWVDTQSWQTKDAMLGFLTECGEDFIFLGGAAEHPVEFYSITVASRGSAAGRFAIGIFSEGQGIAPNLLLHPKTNALLLGFNREVVGIGVPERRVRFRIACDSVFFQFCWCAAAEIVLLFHEIGVIAITEEGNEIWRYSKDIVVDWSIEGGRLCLKFLDSPPVELLITGGSIQS